MENFLINKHLSTMEPDLSGIRLIAADMDGTLLNDRNELSPDFYPLFHALKNRNVLFAAASGRQFYNLENRFSPIKDEMVFIAENGSYVAYKGKEMLVQELDKEIARAQLRAARKIEGTYSILCGKKQAYIESEHPEFVANVNLYYDKVQVVDDLLQVADDQFLKIAICDLAGSEANSYQYFKKLQDELQVKISGSIWLDISHKLANKGKAIEALQREFDLSPDETMVFGDYLNDLEMMQAATYSFAMENAHAEIKRHSRFQAKSNNENGVTEILQRMVSSLSSAYGK